MKVKTNELTDIALDWAVVKSQGAEIEKDFLCGGVFHKGWHMSLAVNTWVELRHYSPSVNWSQGGPIIEREGINLLVHCTVNREITQWKGGKDWPMPSFSYYVGPTPLIAAMRCYVASKLGDEVEIPDELCS